MGWSVSVGGMSGGVRLVWRRLSLPGGEVNAQGLLIVIHMMNDYHSEYE